MQNSIQYPKPNWTETLSCIKTRAIDMMKHFLMVLHLTILIQSSRSQGLQPGDTLPDLLLNNVLNHPSDTMRLSQFRNKLLVLDFWATNCKPCFETMPELEALQKQFRERVQIVFINRNSRDSTLNFFRKRKSIPMPSLPMVTTDTTLIALFPHQVKPHHVWIDGNGIVKQITNSWNTTETAIRDYLQTGKISGQLKQDIADYDQSMPMIAEGNGRWLPKMKYYSFLAHSIRGVNTGNFVKRRSSDQQPYHVARNASSILDLFRFAFNEGGQRFNANNTIELKTKDTAGWTRTRDPLKLDDWMDDLMFSYEIKTDSTGSSIYRMMQEDLSRLFDVEVSIEKQSIPALMLVRTSKKDLLASGGGERRTNIWTSDDVAVKYLCNTPFQVFVSKLNVLFNYEGAELMFMNQAVYNGNVDMEFPAALMQSRDINEWNVVLKNYGLKIVEKPVKADVMAICPKQKKKSSP